MTDLRWLMPALLLTIPACDSADRVGPGPFGDPGPVAAAPVGVVTGFQERPLARGGRAPAVAVLPDGTRRSVHIDPATGWPVLTGDRLEPVPLPALPGTYFETKLVAITASADGALHLVWDPSGAIYHVRFSPEGIFSGGSRS